MKLWHVLLLLFCLPIKASAYVSGINDPQSGRESNLDAESQQRLDDAILTYYKDKNPQRINIVLDMMAYTGLLERKTAWAPLVGFLTVVFPENKNRVMGWMSRNDYNTNAQYIIVNALMHARMKESALLFAKAHQWKSEDLYRLRETQDTVDMKKLKVIVPGHIDTLWGAFFGSGDTAYVEQIIDAMLADELPNHNPKDYPMPDGSNPVDEIKLLAIETLKYYAIYHPAVREVLQKRYDAAEENTAKKEIFKKLLGK